MLLPLKILDTYLHIDATIAKLRLSENLMTWHSNLLRPELGSLLTYNAGLTLEEIASRCDGKPIAKLASNENPYAQGEWTKHGGHAARLLFVTVRRPSRTAARVTATL